MAAAKPANVQNNDTEDEIENTGATRVRFKARTGGRRQTLVVNDYDPEDDYEVPHSGAIDENGRPQYDKSPKRGLIIKAADGKTFLDHKGREVDEKGKVLNPEQYKSEDEDLF
jgi:hypothetical protein